MRAPLGRQFLAVYLLYSQSILSVAIHDLAGWGPAGKSLYHALACAALLKEGTSCSRRSIMKQEESRTSLSESTLAQISA